MRPTRLFLLLPWLYPAFVDAQITTIPGSTTPWVQASSPIPLADYLGLLEQIAPAARQGAEAYLQAFHQRCGRPMTSAELRRAVAEKDGDPVLMQMIRVSYLNDSQTIARLASQVACIPNPPQ